MHAKKSGHGIDDPTTFVSVRPGPGNCVCFCRQRMVTWAAINAASRAGTTKMWVTSNRRMMSVAGNSPPKARNAIHVPITGIDRATE